ncbi:type II secretion system minor pseudopilin GspI [Marinomonas mediterranea]|uniref:Type II secretion system protein I n=1 Tax=Marinomonas mediterranea (strain ATCC 700492 / JCM 21426 / NBRC 103028 / MMB-1) TaxID=717774 RepID=F2K4G7_MARM1|nr:type II secretion system minor pseudopilin GspI [Marinomonas mediterranea]ADZ90266.1 general secretion pathway protein I [Marinomonas mediterranea MMB-1]WCN12384.1 type II secretion system minor pseudopilin GspI [Marinomonas mediterranea]WCN16457.1 type II secretion system minor pseudopilin GspI [Marinomonas mediterranea MMB-1]
MRLRSTKRYSAFTLIEVLMALVILSLVGVTMMQTSSGSVDHSDYLKRKIMATWVAKDRISLARISIRQGQTPSLDEQTVEQGGLQWRSKIELEKQTDLLNRYRVDVFNPPNAESPIYSLQTYFPSGRETPK